VWLAGADDPLWWSQQGSAGAPDLWAMELGGQESAARGEPNAAGLQPIRQARKPSQAERNTAPKVRVREERIVLVLIVAGAEARCKRLAFPTLGQAGAARAPGWCRSQAATEVAACEGFVGEALCHG